MSSIPALEISQEELDRFPIVGIGASAGGLEAFSQLLRHLPPDIGMAFVLVQHLDPAHDSHLSEILTRTTEMPVSEVQDGVTIAPNCVYVIPPDAQMTLSKGTLKLLPRQRTKGKYMAIDDFFCSLAAEQGRKAIAIVLSGSNEDGTLGLSEVKANGGITFAQDLESSEFPHMPQSAIASGHVDFVMTPTEMVDELVKISHHPYVMVTNGKENQKAQKNAKPSAEAQLADPLGETAESLPRILDLLRSAIGVNFSQYKQGTIKRRIMRRMVLHNLTSLEDYVKYLQDYPKEIEYLYNDILINVTSFFRDSASFESLKNHVFPIICQDRSPEAPIRIWCAGCSTGQEAYSIAMSLLEFLDDRPLKPSVQPIIQIFATDISEVMIDRARQGVYAQNLLTDVSPERLRRFFMPVEGGYQIRKLVRELCVFARQNLASDPPFSRLDLISCRNVLIYMEPSLQRKVMPIFHYALKPHGFLMLGSSEGVGELSTLFETIDKKNRIYAHKSTPSRLNFSFAGNDFPSGSPISKSMLPENPSENTNTFNDLNLEEAADRLVLKQYAPAGVVINADLEILQFRGHTGSYLAPMSGKASLDLLKMVRSELTLDLRAMIQLAKKENETVRREGLAIGDQRVDLVVTPFNLSVTGDRFFLILFENSRPSILPSEDSSLSKSKKTRPTASDRKVVSLTQELANTKEYLQSIIETQESTNQDLKVANEEILSSNEELQSTNEELETAKEEIQATNEELSTINDELRNRNLQLNQVNNDLQNFLSSVNIPILMLSGDLRIRRFTPMAEKLFNLIPSDVGRPFSDIHPNISVTNLATLAAATIDTLSTHEQEVRDQSDRWYSLRIRPYKTTDNQIDGAVISLIDIDALKRSSMLLEFAIVETVRSPLIVLDANFKIITTNRAFCETFQLTSAQIEHQDFFAIADGEWNVAPLPSLLMDMLTNQSWIQDFEISQDFIGLGSRTMLLRAATISRVEGDFSEQMILLAIEDITIRKNAEIQIRTSLQEKEVLLHEIRHRVKNNLQVISSLLSLQSSRIIDNAEAVHILQDTQNRVQTIALMYEILHQSPHLDQLNFAEYVQSLVAYLFRSCNLHPEITSTISIPATLTINSDRALLLGLIINELVTNALKYGFSDQFLANNAGEIIVEVSGDRHLTLEVSNSGDTLPVNFDLDAINSVGLNLVKKLVEQLKGELHFDRGDRTTISVIFPFE